MSKHFYTERDMSFRSTVIQRINESSYQSEFYVPDKLWDEFVEFINEIDSEHKERKEK